MIILGIEIALAIMGFIALVRGQINITNSTIVYGAPARLLGLLVMTPIPINIGVGVYIGLTNPGMVLRDWQPFFLIVDIVVLGVVVMLFYLIGYAASVSQKDRIALEELDNELRRRRRRRDRREAKDPPLITDEFQWPGVEGPTKSPDEAIVAETRKTIEPSEPVEPVEPVEESEPPRSRPRKAPQPSFEEIAAPIGSKKWKREEGIPTRESELSESATHNPAVRTTMLVIGGVALAMFAFFVATAAVLILCTEPKRVVAVAPMPPPEPPFLVKKGDWIEPDRKVDWKGPPVAFVRKVEPPREPDPIHVTLVDGKFETKVSALRGFPPSAGHRFVWEGKAGSVYFVNLTYKNGAEAQTRSQIDVVGPGLPPGMLNFRLRTAIAFVAKEAGPHVATVRPDPDDLSFSIRELADDAVLPLNVRIQQLPALAPPVYVGKLVSVQRSCISAFDPNGDKIWFNDAAAKRLECIRTPELRKRLKAKGKGLNNEVLASFTDFEGASLGVDREGRIYAQTFANWAHAFARSQKRPAGDILVWDKLEMTPKEQKLPEPRILPLDGFVSRFVRSPDGAWMYFLDLKNRKLGRIDVKTGTIDRQIGPLASGVLQFCVTPDGKTIYCCSPENAIDVVDATEFRVTRSVKITNGNPVDIAATDRGAVYLVGKEPLGRTAFVADFGRAAADPNAPIPVVSLTPEGQTFWGVTMLPDQRGVLFWGDRHLAQFTVIERPGIFESPSRVTTTGQAFGGDCALSPDGRAFTHFSGGIFMTGIER
jgi:hypothetical protein